MNQSCPLCNSVSSVFFESHKQIFLQCSCCSLIFLHRNFLLTSTQEFERYQLHENNALDKGYQQFVKPLANYIFSNFLPSHAGLDFGSGKDSSISYLLKQQSYNIVQYDPFFKPYNQLLTYSYDYIICCEVIEHFYNPVKEFTLLYSLLKNNGTILCMTDLYNPSIDFGTWYYKNDPTHVSIFSKKTCEWIAHTYGFTHFEIQNRVILFSK